MTENDAKKETVIGEMRREAFEWSNHNNNNNKRKSDGFCFDLKQKKQCRRGVLDDSCGKSPISVDEEEKLFDWQRKDNDDEDEDEQNTHHMVAEEEIREEERIKGDEKKDCRHGNDDDHKQEKVFIREGMEEGKEEEIHMREREGKKVCEMQEGGEYMDEEEKVYYGEREGKKVCEMQEGRVDVDEEEKVYYGEREGKKVCEMQEGRVDVEKVLNREEMEEEEKIVGTDSDEKEEEDEEFDGPAEVAIVGSRQTLEVDYYYRSEEVKEAKWDHLDRIDAMAESREAYIYSTTLKGREFVLEPNVFPYDTPTGIEHWTLWSRHPDLSANQIALYVENWLFLNKKQDVVVAWNYDDNPERSIDIFHVHVYFQTKPPNKVLTDKQDVYDDLVHAHPQILTKQFL